jgi:ADP-ribose pyrophosphatase YjhB (NUDIX family)
MNPAALPEIATAWTPPPLIRPIAIGLLRHEARLLAMRVADASGALVGLRPPGGGVEFGERAEDALRREFREEFDAAIEILGPPAIFENLYRFNGVAGHEIVFAFPIASPALIAKIEGRFIVSEENGSQAAAEWIALERLRAGEFALFPPGLLAHLGQ